MTRYFVSFLVFIEKVFVVSRAVSLYYLCIVIKRWSGK